MATLRDIVYENVREGELYEKLDRNPVPQTNFGVEFIRMQGKLENNQSGDLTRVKMSAQFKF